MHNDYPLSPEKIEIGHNILSNYCSSGTNKYDIGCVNKLIPNLANKSIFAFHDRDLQLYLSLGIKLVSVHKVSKFKQSDWLKKYIDFNTDKRKNAANSFEKDFFKLMNNSTFGKAMENLRKIINIRLVNDAGDYNKYIRKPSFVSEKISSKNFGAIHEVKPVLILNTPIYAGFSILDLSELSVYEFNCGYINRKFSADLLFIDTDSLVYEIKTDDVYEDFHGD